MCLWYFECRASFCKRCEAFCILRVQFLDFCVKFWKKRQSFENVSSWIFFFITEHDVFTVEGEFITWKQVSRAWGKESKVLLLVCVSSKLNFPPNNCMPSSAKMMRKRKSNSSREAMEFIEFSREATRLDKAAQWLRRTSGARISRV